MRANPGWQCGDVEPVPSSAGSFDIVFISVLGVWMADRQVSLQEEDLLVDQLRWETSSPLAQCAASALFPHDGATSEVAAFNSCSKFDGGRKSQPAVKHERREISSSQPIRDGPA